MQKKLNIAILSSILIFNTISVPFSFAEPQNEHLIYTSDQNLLVDNSTQIKDKTKIKDYLNKSGNAVTFYGAGLDKASI